MSKSYDKMLLVFQWFSPADGSSHNKILVMVMLPIVVCNWNNCSSIMKLIFLRTHCCCIKYAMHFSTVCYGMRHAFFKV